MRALPSDPMVKDERRGPTGPAPLPRAVGPLVEGLHQLEHGFHVHPQRVELVLRGCHAHSQDRTSCQRIGGG